jgi:protein O-mannosyl-transferase
VFLAVVPYLAAIHHPLLYDDRTLLDNRWLVREAGPVSVFQHDYWYGTKHESSDLYRPLTVLSLAWNFRATPSKEGIRAVNVALHVVATLCVAWMLGGLFRRRMGTVLRERGQSRAAWIGAALFAVHPLGSEAVLWAVGRAEIAAAILGVAAFTLFMKLDDEKGVGGYRLALSVAAFFTALCFKESAATWLAIGAAWVALRPNASSEHRRALFARSGIYLAAFASYYVLRASAVGWGRHPAPFVDNPLVNADVPTRVVNATLIFVRYLGKMVWPRTLSVEYGFDQIPILPVFPWAGIAAIAIAAGMIAAVVVLHRRSHTTAAFLVVFVPCAFAVNGNLAFPIGTIFGERLAYTPLIGFCGLAGLALAAIPKAAWRGAAVGALLIVGSWRAIDRCGDFRDVATLSEATAAASPRAVKALVNAARTRMRRGDTAAAVPLLERAVAIWPEYARARDLLEQARGGSPPAAGADDEGR